ncbi:MAG: type II secretion system protein [Chthoniobacteraceae bacterium]|jgi:prepilin-type N-terminal cleavage/methylation domain-containing protein/prepilin-type processing-associated H-X9-DG protein
MKNRKRGFTLIELLVVIAIIALLVGLIYPGIKTALASRDESVSLNNMRQIGAAFILYANDHSYVLPGRVYTQNGAQPNKWPYLLSQYLGDVRVYASSFDTSNWIIRGLTAQQAVSNSQNNTSFIMNGYNDLNTFEDSSVTIRLNAFPETSDIILLGMLKIGVRDQFYMDFEEEPNGNENDYLETAAYKGGSNYLFADGSARFISQAEYNAPEPNPPAGGTSLQSYGNSLWCVDKTYIIPTVGNGGK